MSSLVFLPAALCWWAIIIIITQHTQRRHRGSVGHVRYTPTRRQYTATQDAIKLAPRKDWRARTSRNERLASPRRQSDVSYIPVIHRVETIRTRRADGPCGTDVS